MWPMFSIPGWGTRTVPEATHYFVIDIEANGPSPAEHSMLSFATVAVCDTGELVDEFEAVLKPQENHTTHPATMKWWRSQPEAWEAATTNPQSPGKVIQNFADWVEGFSGLRTFAARPLLLDGMWIDHYLRKFVDSHIFEVEFLGRAIFSTPALDIGSYLSGIFNRTSAFSGSTQFPGDWLGSHKHTHRAIDDARGYANALAKLLKIAEKNPPHPDDFLGSTQ